MSMFYRGRGQVQTTRRGRTPGTESIMHPAATDPGSVVLKRPFTTLAEDREEERKKKQSEKSQSVAETRRYLRELKEGTAPNPLQSLTLILIYFVEKGEWGEKYAIYRGQNKKGIQFEDDRGLRTVPLKSIMKLTIPSFTDILRDLNRYKIDPSLMRKCISTKRDKE